ncbi:MAG TPA: SRPBCC family protein [Chitinophagaceae bacterium]|nr:SRPBCC family protein [Chitinophagaceae bacterium]
MHNQPITVTMEVNRSPQDVFAKILDIPTWWTTDFSGNNLKIGDEFIIHHPGEHFSRQRVVELEPGKRIVWLVTESDLPWLKIDQQEWTNTKMVFDLSETQHGTNVRYVHEGLTPDKEGYERVSEGWNMVIKERLFNALKPQDMQDYQATIIVPLTGEETIKRICHVTDWWGVTIEGKPSKPGDEFVIRMTGESFFNMTVTELILGQRMVWDITDCYMPWYRDKTEWKGTRLVFQSLSHGHETRLDFTHEGLTPQSECWADCNPGWTHWIKTSLFSYLTTGRRVFRQPTK